jgi:hypothetical protein
VRGFVYGSIFLIIGGVLLGSKAAGAIAAGGNSLTKGLNHFLSPNYAPIPERQAARTDMGPITPAPAVAPAAPGNGQPRQI